MDNTRDARIELYYKDGSVKVIKFDEPMFQWHRYMMLQRKRPIGLNVFVNEHLCRYSKFIMEYIINYRKHIVMSIYPKTIYQEKVNEYLLRLEQEIKDKCYGED